MQVNFISIYRCNFAIAKFAKLWQHTDNLIFMLKLGLYLNLCIYLIFRLLMNFVTLQLQSWSFFPKKVDIEEDFVNFANR